MECVVFPSTFDKVSENLFEDRALLVKGRLDERNDALQIIVDDLLDLPDDAPESRVDELTPAGRRVVVQLEDVSWNRLNRLSALVSTFRGDDELVLMFKLAGRTRAVRVGDRIDWCSDFERAVAECLGTQHPMHRESVGEDILVAMQPG